VTIMPPRDREQPTQGPTLATRCCAPPTTTRIKPAAALHYAQIFKALADATRLEILGLLAAASGPRCVCELEAGFDLKQPTISHHLRVLREAGLVRAERRGLWVYYSVERGRLREAMGLVHALE
jgi:ArsR family transcriptional regulator